jgi:hypothetical protein
MRMLSRRDAPHDGRASETGGRPVKKSYCKGRHPCKAWTHEDRIARDLVCGGNYSDAHCAGVVEEAGSGRWSTGAPLGLQLSPRLRDLGDQQLYRIVTSVLSVELRGRLIVNDLRRTCLPKPHK